MAEADPQPPVPKARLRAVWKQKETKEQSNMLIGKVLTGKNINKKAVMATIRKGWNLDEETEIVEMASDTFVFKFKSMREKARILRGRPWTVQGALMSIQEWDEYSILSEVSFDHIPFWVQFHNVPLGLLEEETNVQNMGSLVGKLLWYEQPTVKGRLGRCFGRARVLIDVNQPLVTGFLVQRPDESEVWVGVKYERLNSLCYKCGIIGHDFKGCNKVVARDEQGERVYGVWLVASAEKDIDEALTKFAEEWKEEDCRKEAVARGEDVPNARAGKDVADESCPTLALLQPTLAAPKVTAGIKEKGQLTDRLTWQEESLKNMTEETLRMEPTLNGPTKDGKVMKPKMTLSQLGQTQLSESIPSQLESPTKDRVTLGPKPTHASNLSPISAVAQGIQKCSLKRIATDPESPTNSKRRKLFDEGTEDKAPVRRASPSSRRKSVQRVKKEIRRKPAPIGGSSVQVSTPPEIDFPVEWLELAGGRKLDGQDVAVSKGSGGCPNTATTEP